MKPLNLEGQRFERLLVIKKHIENSNSIFTRIRTRWECKCDCGNTTIVGTDELRSKNTLSCGCLGIENRRKSLLRHGLSDSHEYYIWIKMLQRCHNEKDPAYPDYGGRGITVCERWKENFAAFYEDMGPRPSHDHSIDRRDNDKGYCKENCRWATHKEQANNTRRNVIYEIDGIKKTLSEWCEDFKVDYRAVWARLDLGWTIEDALKLPKYARKHS